MDWEDFVRDVRVLVGLGLFVFGGFVDCGLVLVFENNVIVLVG